jgi:hypothetical protein
MLSFHAMRGPLAARCSEIARLGLLLAGGVPGMGGRGSGHPDFAILALVDDHASVLDRVRFEARSGAVSARSAGRDE